MDNREEYDKYINELNSLYEKNPKNVTKEVGEAVKRIKDKESGKKNLLGDIDTDLLLTIGLMIVIALFSLLSPSIDTITIYIFGLAFFAAGLFIGFSQKGFGIIFLFSHGMTGLALMVGSFLQPVFESGLFTENPSNVYLYLGIIISIFIVALLITILVNLSDNLKRVKYIRPIVIGIYGVGFLLVAILPRILSFIVNFKL